MLWLCCFEDNVNFRKFIPGRKPADRESILDLVVKTVLSQDEEFRHLFTPETDEPEKAGSQQDCLILVGDEGAEPDAAFNKLRWGGQLVYSSANKNQIAEMSKKYTERGFTITSPPISLREKSWLPFLGAKVHYFVARKVSLTMPREFNDRFTYHVHLVADDRTTTDPNQQQWIVQKEVPSVERVAARLRKKFPDVSEDVVLKRARKFSEKIFPLFLTREAAMLQILQRNLPAKFANKVPRLLDMEQDERGYVRKLRMNWLRNGGKPIAQIEFARQCTELLHVLHDTVGVIHLDLRLDNIVITDNGVGFVDFGSSVRVGENLQANPLLGTLYDELMRTSEIQRMLQHMTHSGSVTSPIIQNGYQKVDKSVDFFYLALQMNDPLKNPDFTGLVNYDPASQQARELRQMTEEVLRPKDLKNPKFQSAFDMLRGIQMIADSMRPSGSNIGQLTGV